MPFNPAGVYTLPNGYAGVDGQPILTSQHNPPLEDIQAALSLTLLRDGRAPMTADLNMNSFKLTNLATGVATTDAVNKSQMETADALKISLDGSSPNMSGSLKLRTSINDGYQLDSISPVTVPNNSGVLFTNGSGLLIINDHNSGSLALALCGGGNVVLISQTPGTTFTTTANNPGTVNVFFEGSPFFRYQVQNLRGGPINLTTTFIRTRNSV